MKKIILFITVLVFSFSCVKRQKGSPTPEIEYIEFNAYKTDDGNDASYHLFKFLDGDGDLFRNQVGDGPNFVSNFFYLDSVTKQFIPFVTIKKLVEPGKTDTVIFRDTFGISQTVVNPKDISFKDQSINGTILVPSKEYRPSNRIKTFFYTYYIIDRAGNKSNKVTTPTITVP